MKIFLVGSTQYKNTRFPEVKIRLETGGHDVKIPAFNGITDKTGLLCCDYNRTLVEWADEIHLIWDNKSVGAIFDMGMVFYARKKLVVEYIESKNFGDMFKAYAECY